MTAEYPTPSTPSRRKRIANNPIYWREHIMRSRGKFPRTMKIVYAIFGGLFLLLMCGIALTFSRERTSQQVEAFAYAILASVLLFQLFITIFFVPPFTAGAITEERKRETLDILLTTTISPRQIVDGKLFSSLPFILRLVFLAGLALIISLASENITLLQVLASQLIILITVLLLATYSLLLSTLMRSTLYVMITVYGSTIFYLIASGFLEAYLIDGFSDAPVGFNLLFTLVAAFIPDEIFSITNPLVYTIFYGMLAYFLYQASIYRVKKIANR